MNLKDMTKEELELLSYTDLTNMLLKENGKSMSTADIFKEICNLLGYSFDEHIDKIGDYYTSLTLDKRFVWLDSREWDLRERRAVEIVIDDEEEEDSLEEIEEIEDEEEDIEESIEDEDDLNDSDDDIEDLAIIEDEEDEELGD